ncbi:hypothetical protein [Microvirga sesbaniae]|uniref:hypothetical protein n=1 Tax=Microvirga sesbaniae TaxID=681392 RepID=UPI0021C78914|nr:hypothetical protein [Microvirga sp. HBU67692]
MLRCLLVVTVALGLASAPVYAAAQAAASPVEMTVHQKQAGQTVQAERDHHQGATSKHHAMGQSCCHPGCIMAVVPGFASLAPIPLPWVSIPIPRDLEAVPIAASGLDRPPKLA